MDVGREGKFADRVEQFVVVFEAGAVVVKGNDPVPVVLDLFDRRAEQSVPEQQAPMMKAN